jgi:hypothetical protein
VRAAFNPSANSLVDEIKAKSAELIDMCAKITERAKHNPNISTSEASEIGRLCSIAQTYYEDAAMWAVKAATA